MLLAGAPVASQLSFSDQSVSAGANVIHSHSFASEAFVGDEAYREMVAGFGVGDFDNNGYCDFFFASGGLRRDRLLMNNGDSSFTNKAAEYGVAGGHLGSACSVANFDGDGWLDLFLASHGSTFNPGPGSHLLFHNEGGTHFTEVAVQAGVNHAALVSDGFGSCWGDYDLDGDLDLFLTSWLIAPVPPSMGNRLFRNEGNGTFSDVTQAAGVELSVLAGFSPTFADMNGDRYPELLVVADFTTARYFANNGDGTFTDRTVSSGTGLESNGMGSAIGDVNGDGLIDWYTSSIYELPEGNPQRDGNELYINLGDQIFNELAASSRVDDGGWGSALVDLDHDTDLDIIEVNGWRDDDATFTDEPAYVWLNVNQE